ncbi:MAG: tRNA (adenosine(37)-N6)-threonylcarbamoyltransferase complex ATPase subunit type 1 TsaE [Acidimicrobiia bacterium]
MTMATITTDSEAATTAAGRAFAERLSPGDIVLISGPLGAGKTAFVRGLAEGVGADPSDVSSPTFTLIQQYPGRLPVVHVDLYRLNDKEAADLNLSEMGEDGVLVVEWPDRWPAAPRAARVVTIDDTGGDTRRIRF